jgi:hypothetical protein
MQINPDAIFDAARSLPEPELFALVSRLLESLPAQSEGLSLGDAELEMELDRRFADEEGAIPWTELRDEK